MMMIIIQESLASAEKAVSVTRKFENVIRSEIPVYRGPFQSSIVAYDINR